jgi:hypothetical protein
MFKYKKIVSLKFVALGLKMYGIDLVTHVLHIHMYYVFFFFFFFLLQKHKKKSTRKVLENETSKNDRPNNLNMQIDMKIKQLKFTIFCIVLRSFTGLPRLNTCSTSILYFLSKTDQVRERRSKTSRTEVDNMPGSIL